MGLGRLAAAKATLLLLLHVTLDHRITSAKDLLDFLSGNPGLRHGFHDAAHELLVLPG